jgi:uncharacterized protein YndB with AHSA1/START domain
VTIPTPPPFLSTQLRSVTEFTSSLSPQTVFQAWTEKLDQWLATPGTLMLIPKVNTAFYFETGQGDERQPYYGRFLTLDPNLLSFTWLSTGTLHTETVITISLTPVENGTLLRLTHIGFPNEELREAHEAGWPIFLAEMEKAFK